MKHSSYLEYFLDMKNTFISGCNNTQIEKEIDKDFENIFLDFLRYFLFDFSFFD